jgi:diguanylate cyclase (GGDEF)-like protein
MNQVAETLQDTVKLLSANDLDEVMSATGDILLQNFRAAAVGIATWSSELERACNSTLFGTQRKSFQSFFEAYLSIQNGVLETVQEVDSAVVATVLPAELKPVFACPLQHNNELVGYLLIAGTNVGPTHINAVLKSHHITLAISRAWKQKQLEQQNDRFRSQYEELKSNVLSTEENTRELIHDAVSKDSLNAHRLERERLVCSMSNIVRNSLQINEILQKAVAEIGKSFNVTNCILFCPTASQDQSVVYEWHHQAEPPLAEHFSTTLGMKFMHRVMTSDIPQDLSSAVIGRQDRSFLSKLGLSSGLMIPLTLQNRVLGAILLKDSTSDRPWNVDDSTLLDSLSSMLSIAIENAQLHHECEVQAVTDPLTGITNRHHFNEMFVQELARAKRYGTPLSLVMLDLDHLQKINDSYGHQTGDKAIQNIAQVLQRSSRSIDLAARYGGEEFCLLLPNTNLDEAKLAAHRLRQLICSQHINGSGSQNLTASIGVAAFPVHAASCDELFTKADAAMYHAKKAGRNRVCIAK